MPWLLGPIRTVCEPSSAARTRTMSSTGTRSVTQVIRPMPASIASIIASAALCAGTRIRLASGCVSLAASATVSKTGRPTCVLPPLPGRTPPTYSEP